jgi:hypothetical protein
MSVVVYAAPWGDRRNRNGNAKEGVMDYASLIIQLLAGVAGGNAVGKGAPSVDLGPLTNSIIGAIGGIGGGQVLQALIPALAGAASGDVGPIIGQLVGGGLSGAILTAIIGFARNAMAGQQKA